MNSLNTYLIIIAFVTLLFVIIIVDLFLIIKNKNQRILLEQKQREKEISDLMNHQEITTINAALDGQEKERQRIARELHDNIGASLSLAKMQYSEMEQELKKLELQNRKNFESFSGLLEKTMDDVRRISHDLYGSTVSKLGLEVAIRQLASAVQKSSNLQIVVHIMGLPAMTYEKEINVYRCIQELLSNTMKYAKAKQVHIQLIDNGTEISLTYEDDGVGFDTKSQKSGMGLQSIGDRLQLIGATWSLDSSPGQGMILTANFINDTGTSAV